MTQRISEAAFEQTIVEELTRGAGQAGEAGMVAEATLAFGDDVAQGGYRLRKSGEYHKELCLLPRDVTGFVMVTQPEEWQRLRDFHGDEVKTRFLRRLSREVERRGTLEVLRNGIKDSGCRFQLAYFRPHSGLNPDLRRLYQSNVFSVVRQLAYLDLKGESDGERGVLDLVLFLNGLPIFTAELKNRFTGGTVKDAMQQYRKTRDPRQPLFGFGRCLAHFAVDPELVQVTTHLNGPKTRFLPFNKGHDGRAGNPPVPPTRGGYRTSYLWREVWARDSVLNLVQHFVHRVQKEETADGGGRRRGSGGQLQLFPRYHQLDAVRRLVAHARQNGPGQQYLVEHSAGSGKSFTIAWLAHWLSVLHDEDDRRVFDSIVVITDRKVLDQQLQETIRQFEQTLGVVENIDATAKQLQQALEEGKTIIVTTLQKFPEIVEGVGELAGQRFAIVVDEAHSSQTGEHTKALKTVLSTSDLDEAAREEAGEPDSLEDRVVEEMTRRGRLANASFFAFTATPKPKTLELFGTPDPVTGKPRPFSLYSMRQAIDEGFILDVLENYTTYETYWKLLKTVQDDPRFERSKAERLLKSFVELHEHAIGKKVEIMVEHFHQHVRGRIGGEAKAMVVTRSRLHCVRTKLALDRYLAEQGYPYKSLVAFSGTVEDGGKSYTESAMNGRVPDSRTAAQFERPEYRFMVVANKFQTGFDQPLLHTMYVDKKLGGVNAVQTLSRLNRTHPRKDGTMVLDFANEAEAIRKAFEPYYGETRLSETTDPNKLYDREQELLDFGVFTQDDVDAFAELYFRGQPQERLYAALDPVRERVREQLDEDGLKDLRSALKGYIRLYGFLSQVIVFTDPDLEKLYAFARLLRRHLDVPKEELPEEIKEMVDMDSLRIDRTYQGRLQLEEGKGELAPPGERGGVEVRPEELEPLSRIIEELNERFGSNLGPEDRITLGRVLDQAQENETLRLSVENNSEENARLAFDTVVRDLLQDLVETNFKLYKKVSENKSFAENLMAHLFDRFRERIANGGLTTADVLREIGDGETKHREFKSTLRYNLHTEKYDKALTHAALKTVAAFQNTEGGVLYLGVADDGTILGLENDGFANPDKFLLHLNNVAKTALGKPAAARLTPRIWRIRDRDVCRVECPPSRLPVFLKFQGEEKFYVRSGPSTEELAPSEMHSYVGERFGEE